MHERREWRVTNTPSGDEIRAPGAYLRTVVRIFPDYARGAVWFVDGGAVDYAESRISEDLVLDLVAWEDAYYAALDETVRWRSPELAQQHAREGLRLARALSEELGDAFAVEVAAEDDVSKIRILGTGPGTNAAAIAVFRGWAAQSEAEHARNEQLKASGATFEISGYRRGRRLRA